MGSIDNTENEVLMQVIPANLGQNGATTAQNSIFIDHHQAVPGFPVGRLT